MAMSSSGFSPLLVINSRGRQPSLEVGEWSVWNPSKGVEVDICLAARLGGGETSALLLAVALDGEVDV